jgi:hypothetical protein
MSKQSERKRQELQRAKVIAKSPNDLMIPAAPNPSGDDIPTANEGHNDKKNKLTFLQLVECGGIAGIFGIWAEMWECHDVVSLSFWGLALFVLYGAFCHFIYNLLKKIHISLIIIFFVALNVFTAWFVHENSQPLPANVAGTRSVEINSNKSEEPAALSALAEKLQSTADLLSQATSQRDDLNAKLIAAQSATEPRKINLDQRKKFIALLSDVHASKISIPVIVGNKDSETDAFAEQFREMLTVAGYGTNAPKSLPPPKEDIVWVTNNIIAAIPRIGTFGKQEILNFPGLNPVSPNGKWGQKNVEVFAVLSDTNGLSPELMPAFMPMKASPSNTNGGELFAYHPTDKPNAIIIGICNALVENGISVGFMNGKGILPEGNVAFFIPQKFF